VIILYIFVEHKFFSTGGLFKMKISDQIKQLYKDAKYFILFLGALMIFIFAITIIPAMYHHIIEPDFIVALDAHGLAFKKYGWFNSEFYPLKPANGKWAWQSRDGVWNQVTVPYDHYDKINPTAEYIVLTNREGAYLKTGNTHYPMKFVKGANWYYNQEGQWLSLEDRYNSD